MVIVCNHQFVEVERVRCRYNIAIAPVKYSDSDTA